MASELRVNTLKDAAGNNSIATSFVAGGSAKAYANNDDVSSNLKSFNVSSFTDVATGLPQQQLTSNMSDGLYVITACIKTDGGFVRSNANQTTTSKWRLQLLNTSASVIDADSLSAITGDLA